MSNTERVRNAAAIREAVLSDLDPATPSAQLLLERIEHMLFERCALAPADAVGARVLQLLRREDTPEALADDALLRMHDEHCARLAADFAMDADAWDDSLTERYRERASRAFGVELSALSKLFLTFHALPKSQRLGIFLAIENAPLFAYLSREIDAYSGDARADNPTKSLRSLLRTVFSDE